MKDRNHNRQKGFTLVELLAVIIVLAVIMLIAVNAILPLITQARTGAFASTANTAIDAVSTVVLADELNGRNQIQCYSIKYLVDNGYLTKITADADHYEGVVIVHRGTTSGTGAGTANTYDIYITDQANNYSLSQTGLTAGTLVGDQIDAAYAPEKGYALCSDFDTDPDNSVTWTAGTHYHTGD